jgi:hypothetical protein
VAGLDALQEVDAGAAGHADVGDQHLRLVGRQRGHDVAAAAEAAHGELLAAERLLEDEADGLVVVDDPDGLHGWPVMHGSPVRLGSWQAQPPGFTAAG